MSELQATVEFLIELDKFVNVDLFQRGFYQIRLSLHTSPEAVSKVEATLPNHRPVTSFALPSYVLRDFVVCSKTFQILYRNEEVVLSDVALFRAHVLIDSDRLDASLSRAGFFLSVDLWFCEHEHELPNPQTNASVPPSPRSRDASNPPPPPPPGNNPSNPSVDDPGGGGGGGTYNGFEHISHRSVVLNFKPKLGLHHHLPLIFDYFHLCAIELTVHASLVSLHQPYITVPKKEYERLQKIKAARFDAAASRSQGRSKEARKGNHAEQTRGRYRAREDEDDDEARWETEEILAGRRARDKFDAEANAEIKRIWERRKKIWEEEAREAEAKEAQEAEGILARPESKHTRFFFKLPKPNAGWLGSNSSASSSRTSSNANKTTTSGNEVNSHDRKLPDSTLETVLFGSSTPGHSSTPDNEFQGCLTAHSSPNNSTSRLKRARKIHYEMCHLLLSAYDALQRVREQAQELNGISTVPPPCKNDAEDVASKTSSIGWGINGPVIAKSNCDRKLQLLTANVVSVVQEDDMLHITNTNITQLSAELVVLWGHVLDLAIQSKPVKYDLCRLNHVQRVQRFAEAFFLQKHQKSELINIDDVGLSNNLVMAQQVRNSLYMTNLPPLSCECTDLDGEPSTLPVIFEDVYSEAGSGGTGPSNGLVPSKSSQSCSDAGSRFSSPDSGRRAFQVHSPESARRSRHHSSTSSNNSATSGDSGGPAFPRASGGGANHLIKHRKYLVGSGALATEAFRDNPGQVVLLGYKQSSSALEGGREVAVGTLLRSGVGGVRTSHVFPGGTSSTSGVSSVGDEEDPASARAMHGSDSMPYISHLRIDGRLALVDCLPSSPPASPSSTPLANMASLSGSLPDLASQDVVLDFPPQMTKSQQLMGHFRTDTVEGMQARAFEEDLLVGPIRVQETNLDDNDEDSGVNGGFGFDSSEPAQLPVNNIFERTEAEEDPPDRSHWVYSHYGSAWETGNATITADDVSTPSVNSSLLVNRSSGPTASPQVKCMGTLNCIKSDALTHADPLVAISHHSSTVGSSSSYSLNHVNSTARGTTAPPSGLAAVTRQPHSIGHGAAHVNSALAFSRTASGQSLTPMSSLSSMYNLSAAASQPGAARIFAMDHAPFITAREEFKRQTLGSKYPGYLCSDFPQNLSPVPYFFPVSELDTDVSSDVGCHLIICVHGLDGNEADLRLVKTYLDLCLPLSNIHFLMSEKNRGDTFSGFEKLTENLVDEIFAFMTEQNLKPDRISFIGHSLGNIIIRGALAHFKFQPLLSLCHTLLSLSGPHLGTLYNSSTLVSTGMWFMQKWKKSDSLLQLSFKDSSDMRKTYLYSLSRAPGLSSFRHVLLVASQQDKYVPFASARIEMIRSALKDLTGVGAVYAEMVQNILGPLIESKRTQVIRYDVHHALPNTANSLIGRAAHIAVLDSEVFIEKFVSVSAWKYFK